MAFDADDLALFFDPDMPGYALATIGGAPVPGLFRNPYAEALGLVAGVRPEFRAAAADLDGASVGATVTILGTAYTVAERHVPADDPAGVGLLILEAP